MHHPIFSLIELSTYRTSLHAERKVPIHKFFINWMHCKKDTTTSSIRVDAIRILHGHDYLYGEYLLRMAGVQLNECEPRAPEGGS